MILGNNGVLNKANEAKLQSIIATEKEQVQLAYTTVKIKKVTEANDLSTEEEMKTALKNSGITEREAFVKTEKGKITVTYTETLHKYIVEENGTIKGPVDANAPPDLEVSDIETKMTPSGWTKGKVTVEITNTIPLFTLQYSLNAADWDKYQNAITCNDNQAIYLRFVNQKGEAGGYATVNILNIDRLEPNNFTPTASNTSNSITLTGTAIDKTATAVNGSSGIGEYYFSKDNGASWQTNSNKGQNSYTYKGLTQNTTYTLKMKAIDKAGNEVITNSITKATGGVPSGGSVISFSYTPSTPTNGTVSVGITTTASGYTLQYSTNASTWTNYTSNISFAANGVIYARLYDGTNAGGYATGNVTNIDKVAPTVSHTTNPVAPNKATMVVVTISATDSSGIKSTTNVTTGGITKVNDTTYNVTANGSYTIKVIDKAGNEANYLVKITNIQMPPPILTGFYYVGGSVASGYVISDVQGDDMSNSKGGNQFVWVPVDDPTTMYGTEANGKKSGKLYNFSSTGYGATGWTEVNGVMKPDAFYGEPKLGAGDTSYSGGKITQESLQQEFDQMIASVIKNGGFYIGRYEMSLNSSKNAQIKKGATSSDGRQTDTRTWHGLYAKAKTYSNPNNANVKSGMIWGSQYDAMLRWIQASNIDVTAVGGSKRNKTRITGSLEADQLNNIYDLVGNSYEYTMQAYNWPNSKRAFRGGLYGNGGGTENIAYLDGRSVCI